KEIKQVRALLRLVRAKIGSNDFRRRIKLLRRAADCLGPARDSYVKLQALKKIARHFRGKADPRSLDFLRRKLQESFKDQIERFSKKKVATSVERPLRKLSKNLSKIAVCGKGWKAIGSGVSESYKQGRKRYQKARAHPSAENLHEWRKRAKDLWY